MPFAEGTSVPVERSKSEIERILNRYGADEFVQGTSAARALVGFRAGERRVRFQIKLPEREKFKRQVAWEQENRRVWRCLCLVIKAKLEAVDSQIESFEQAFMPHIVMPDGKTFSEVAMPAIERAYKTGQMPPLMLGMGEGR